MVIITLDDFQVTEHVVSSLHHMFPNLNILARGHDTERCKILQAQGARLAVSENLEASIALARSALSQVSIDDAKNDEAIDQYRNNYY